jgi:hypothetical protein
MLQVLALTFALLVGASGQALICAAPLPFAPVSVWASAPQEGPYRAFLYGATAAAPEAWFPLGSAGALAAGGGSSVAFWFPSISPASASAHALAAFVVPLASAGPWGSATDLGPEAPPAAAAPGPIPPALAAAAVQQGAVLRGGGGASPQAGCAGTERTGGVAEPPADFAASLQRALAALDPQAAPSPATAAASALPGDPSSGAASAAAAAAAAALALLAGVGLLL